MTLPSKTSRHPVYPALGLLVTCGIVATALVAPVAEGKPLLAGSRQTTDQVTSALSRGSSDVSWNDVLAGTAAGAVLAYLALRVVRALRRAGHAAPIEV
jgi:hypothetical protein